MKQALVTLTVLFTLLWVAACAPLEHAFQPTQIPAPATVRARPTLSPMVGTAIPPGSGICNCPTSVAATPPEGFAQPPLIICSCPAILIPPTEVGSNLEPGSMREITLADNGRTLTMHPREHFLLNLGTEIFNWLVTVDNRNVLSQVPSMVVTRGAQGIYVARNLGQALLTAVGEPVCRNSKPVCMAPEILFRVTVIVH
ncbi:MAG: hypothetical protein ABSG98_03045 [Anaerolineales bacterium]|jgi:hypothetical protein